MTSSTTFTLTFESVNDLDGTDLADLVGKVISAAEAAGYTTRTQTRTTNITAKVSKS